LREEGGSSMKYLYNPQRSDDLFTYTFEGDVVKVVYQKRAYTQVEVGQDQELEPLYEDVLTIVEEHTDTFDFSSMPDGEAEEVETTLPINPIIKASRVDGVLELELLNLIGEDATEAERFPDWKEVL
jgi:hypothetical protein